MKNKVKNILFCTGTFYMIIIAVLMMITYFNMSDSIILSSNDEYQSKLNQYKEKVNSLDNSKCRDYMNTLITKVEKDISVNEISLKDYYKSINSEDSLLSYYPKASESCESITNKKMHDMNMPIKFLTPGILGDEIFRNYIYQYELGLQDKKSREINAANLIPVENNIRAANELQIIEELLQNIDWEKEAQYEK